MNVKKLPNRKKRASLDSYVMEFFHSKVLFDLVLRFFITLGWRCVISDMIQVVVSTLTVACECHLPASAARNILWYNWAVAAIDFHRIGNKINEAMSLPFLWPSDSVNSVLQLLCYFALWIFILNIINPRWHCRNEAKIPQCNTRNMPFFHSQINTNVISTIGFFGAYTLPARWMNLRESEPPEKDLLIINIIMLPRWRHLKMFLALESI